MWIVTCRELGVAPSAYLRYVAGRVAMPRYEAFPAHSVGGSVEQDQA